MEFSQEEKKLLEAQIVTTIQDGLEKGVLTEKDPPLIADFVLERIDAVRTRQEVILFLSDLAARWPHFLTLRIIAQGKYTERIEAEVAGGVAALAEHGKIEEAISLAKSATQA